MYYRTKRTSETGLKFCSLIEKIRVQEEQIKNLSEKYGFTKYLRSRTCFSGLSSVTFETKDSLNIPDSKYWKRLKWGYYIPKVNTKKGKEIAKDFNSVITITSKEVNSIVGYELDNPWGHIGLAFKQDTDYIGFETTNEIDFTPPADCEEITYTEYKKL